MEFGEREVSSETEQLDKGGSAHLYQNPPSLVTVYRDIQIDSWIKFTGRCSCKRCCYFFAHSVAACFQRDGAAHEPKFWKFLCGY